MLETSSDLDLLDLFSDLRDGFLGLGGFLSLRSFCVGAILFTSSGVSEADGGTNVCSGTDGLGLRLW